MEQERLPREGISELDTGSEWEYALWQSANRENSLFGFRIFHTDSCGKRWNAVLDCTLLKVRMHM